MLKKLSLMLLVFASVANIKADVQEPTKLDGYVNVAKDFVSNTFNNVSENTEKFGTWIGAKTDSFSNIALNKAKTIQNSGSQYLATGKDKVISWSQDLANRYANKDDFTKYSKFGGAVTSAVVGSGLIMYSLNNKKPILKRIGSGLLGFACWLASYKLGLDSNVFA